MLVLKTGMGEFSSWVNANYNAIQVVGLIITSVGVIVSLQSNAAASRRDAISNETKNIFTQSEHHSKLWDKISQNPKLSRVLSDDPKVLEKPIEAEEEVFINEAITHYLTSWRVASTGGFIKRKELILDVQWFFSKPLPQAIWEKDKRFKNPQFVKFVCRALEAAVRLRLPCAFNAILERQRIVVSRFNDSLAANLCGHCAA